MSQKSNELKAQGVDVINLSVGEPDFNTPDHIKEAAKRAIDENFTFYTAVPGYMSLRKAVSRKLKEENGGETVNSVVFQHIIVPEIYDVLKKIESKQPYAVEHIYNEDEYYAFDPENVNYGTLNEKPCPGYYNDGQFDALVENGDVLAMFTGHDHTNAFGVRNQNIDIFTSPMTRYKGLAYTTQYGYRVVEIDENDTSTYITRVERLYDVFDHDYAKEQRESGDKYSKKISYELAVKGRTQKIFTEIYQSVVELFTGRTVTYPDYK
jgi:hypothetical protein